MSIDNLILMAKAKDDEETDRCRKGSPHLNIYQLSNHREPFTISLSLSPL